MFGQFPTLLTAHSGRCKKYLECPDGPQHGERLGYLDREMQLRQLSLYESEFERMIQKAKETAPAKKKLYHSLGVFGGAMLAILFW